MAQVTVTKMVEGPSNIIIKLGILGDGTGELSNQVVLSPSDLIPARRNIKPAFRISQLWYGMVWFDVTLGFGTLIPVPVWTIARDSDSHTDFRSFGGLTDESTQPPGDQNGELWVSTNGLVLGSQGSIIIELRKNNP